MIVRVRTENGLIRTYSDIGVYIHGGYPEGDYAEAIDRPEDNRLYTETDRKIEVEDMTSSEYKELKERVEAIESGQKEQDKSIAEAQDAINELIVQSIDEEVS